MQNYKRLWLIGCMAVLSVAAAGCFQAAGTGPETLSVVQNTNPTWTPFPSDTPPVTSPPLVVTATQNESGFVPTAEFGQPTVEQPTLPVAQAQFPTQPPAVAQFPTQEPGISQAQSDQGIDPIYITATFIVGRATQTAAFELTATAGGPIVTPTLPATVAPFGPTATFAPVPGAGCVYTVAAGDNLFRIALKYGTTPQALASANGIPNMNLILVGQQVSIPNCGSTGTIATPIPGTSPVTSGGTTYTVQQGDTLFSISLKFGVPLSSIAAANGISNINLILVNQQLVIPPA